MTKLDEEDIKLKRMSLQDRMEELISKFEAETLHGIRSIRITRNPPLLSGHAYVYVEIERL